MLSPASSCPTNMKFFRPRATTRSADSLRLLSGGIRASSRKRVSSSQLLRAYLDAQVAVRMRVARYGRDAIAQAIREAAPTQRPNEWRGWDDTPDGPPTSRSVSLDPNWPITSPASAIVSGTSRTTSSKGPSKRASAAPSRLTGDVATRPDYRPSRARHLLRREDQHHHALRRQRDPQRLPGDRATGSR